MQVVGGETGGKDEGETMNDEGERRKEEKLEKQKSGKAIGKDEGETMNDEGERRKAEKRKSGKSRN